jgi:hypothetical protein
MLKETRDLSKANQKDIEIHMILSIKEKEQRLHGGLGIGIMCPVCCFTDQAL